MESRKKLFIEKIFKENFIFSNVHQSLVQSNILDTISKDIYPDPKRFIMEILQNADDSSFNYQSKNLNIVFNFFNNTLIISHQGQPFNEDDIVSICSAGNSTKIRLEKATGYKGIGFKSVFEHSNKVVIISGGYQFRFDKNHFSDEFNWQPEWGSLDEYKSKRALKNLPCEIKKPWQIIPICTEKHEIEEKYWNVVKNFPVNFIVCFNSNETFKTCKSYLLEIEQDYQYLLFLKSKEMNFQLYEDGISMSNISKRTDQYSSEGSYIQLFNKNRMIESFFMKTFNVDITNDIHRYKDELSNEDIPDKLKISKSIDISFAMPYIIIKNELILTEIPKEKRVLYAFLPTKVNYNFPFLINTNFLLDAGRTQIREGPWNKMIFSILARKIHEYQNTLFEYFRNSFANSLLFDLKISYKVFEDVFMKSSIKKNVEELYVFTKTGLKKLYKECYFNEFYIKVNEKRECKNIIDFFNIIYGIEKSDGILKTYFIEDKNIKFDIDHEIDEKDHLFMEKLKEYYKSEYYCISENEIMEFLKSESYRRNFNPIYLYNFLENIIQYEGMLESIKELNIIPDKTGNFFKSSEFMIYQTSDDENKNIVISKLTDKLLKSNDQSKKEIDPSVINFFAEKENLDLLELIGVERIDYQNTLNYLLKNISKFYKADDKNKQNIENSIAIVKLVFEEWAQEKDIEKKSILDRFKQVNYLLNQKGEFTRFVNLVINPFYNEDNTFKKYEDNYVSDVYYEKNSDKKKWVKFFFDLELWEKNHYNSCFLMSLDKEQLEEIPYILPEYKTTISFSKREKFIQVFVCPRINYIFDETPENIKSFLDLNIRNIYPENDQRIKINIFKNYFYWLIIEHKKLMLTRKLKLKPINSIFSYSILKDKSEKLKEFLLENLDFCVTENVDYNINLVFELRKSYNLNELKSILSKLITFSTTVEDKKELEQIKKYFMNLLFALVMGAFASSNVTESKKKGKKNNSNKNSKDNSHLLNYSEMFLDEDNNFRNAESLYYFQDDHIKDLFEQKLKKKKFSELKLPDTDKENEIDKFIEFAKKNGVRVYSMDDIKYLTVNIVENKELFSKIESMSIHIQKLCLKLGHEIEVENKLKTIKFYCCPKISITTDYGDLAEHGISYCEKHDNNLKVYHLKDEIYTTWKHVTILFYVSKHFAKHLECEEISQEIQNLLMLDKEEDIERLLENII